MTEFKKYGCVEHYSVTHNRKNYTLHIYSNKIVGKRQPLNIYDFEVISSTETPQVSYKVSYAVFKAFLKYKGVKPLWPVK
jgi:hypothetical protein